MQQLKDLFDDSQLRLISDAPQWMGDRHPTWFPLYHETPRAIDFLVNRAVAIISRQNGGDDWLRGKTPRLLDLAEYNNAASTLAEIRAYGGLLAAGFEVSPIAESADVATPEFSIDAGDGPTTVEVFSKHQDEKQDELVDAAHSFDRPLPPDVRRNTRPIGDKLLTTTTVVIAPGGIPDPKKSNDSVTANFISRVCSIKQDERQISADRPALLIADFANFGGPVTSQFTTPVQTAPIVSGHTAINSGAIWYAMYGWKNAPIFQESSRKVRMGHDGRFRIKGAKQSRLSGLLAVFAKGAVLLENPWALHRLPEKARLRFLNYPWFDLTRTVADWQMGDADQQVAVSRRMIETLDLNIKISLLDTA
jgi:hypothetical protein